MDFLGAQREKISTIGSVIILNLSTEVPETSLRCPTTIFWVRILVSSALWKICPEERKSVLGQILAHNISLGTTFRHEEKNSNKNP